jgi:hypothetical protein
MYNLLSDVVLFFHNIKWLHGFVSGNAQAQKLRIIPDEAPNMTDVEESIRKLNENDKELKSLNLNNIKVSKYMCSLSVPVSAQITKGLLVLRDLHVF